ncbi:hypothetical protein SLEP1_g11635 [Rubroshorea leprosula]|nr:hypothetical protein SLEP1_g11635 [Rubroshorea leprosula]
MSRNTVEHMTWHLKCREDADEVIHSAGSEAWKHFDETHPTFVDEPRNVKLGLYTDGFNPFGYSATPYSCWPLVVDQGWWVNANLLLADHRSAGETLNTDLLPDLLPCGFFFAEKRTKTEEWRLGSGEAKKENDG